MGVYAITGGSSGIGAKTVELLKKNGHQVVNIDLKKCDTQANLATPEGRQTAIDALHQMHPEGLDGLICSAGVSGACGNLGLIISLNFFGTISIVKGVYDLLKKKGGTCVVTTSNTISQGAARMDIADLLNNNNDEEQRILNLVSRMDGTNLSVGNSIYVATKYAVARWMRRHSATYAANGGPHQCSGAGKCKHGHDSHHVLQCEIRTKRPAHSHQIRQGNLNGARGDRFCYRFPVLRGCQRGKRECDVCGRGHRRPVKHGKSILKGRFIRL